MNIRKINYWLLKKINLLNEDSALPPEFQGFGFDIDDELVKSWDDDLVKKYGLPRSIDPSQVIKKKISGINYIKYYEKKKEATIVDAVWAFRAPVSSEEQAKKIGIRAQKALKGIRTLPSTIPTLHTRALYVGWNDEDSISLVKLPPIKQSKEYFAFEKDMSKKDALNYLLKKRKIKKSMINALQISELEFEWLDSLSNKEYNQNIDKYIEMYTRKWKY